MPSRGDSSKLKLPPRQSFRWKFHIVASVGSLVRTCLFATNQHLIENWWISSVIRVIRAPPHDDGKIQNFLICVCRQGDIIIYDIRYCKWLFFLLHVSIFELKACSTEDTSFQSFVFLFAFSESRGLAMPFSFFHSRKFGSCPSGEHMHGRVPVVLLQLTVADFRQDRHLPSAAWGSLFWYIVFSC